MNRRLKGKIALITGASRGIGASIAKRYAQEGAQLILIARSIEGLEAVDDEVQRYGSKSLLVPLDLLDLPRISDLGKFIADRYKKLDILVGNAAILGGLSPITHYSPSTWHQVINLNLNANWHLLRTFDPFLKKAPQGRALFVTSGITAKVHAYWGAYATSKAGLEMMAKTYAIEVQKTSIKVNLVSPGAIQTSLRAEAMPGEEPSSLRHPDEITEIFVKLAENSCPWHGEILKA